MRSLFLICFLAASGLSAPPVQPVDPGIRLMAFCKRHFPASQNKYVPAIIIYTKKWAGFVAMDDRVPDLLSMAYRESGFDPKAKNPKEDSEGTYQTCAHYHKKIRAWWLANGYDLPRDESVEAQCAFGVAEYYKNLMDADGDVFDGIRRYNGGARGGKGLIKAKAYAYKVLRARRFIFGTKYTKGERHQFGHEQLKVEDLNL